MRPGAHGLHRIRWHAKLIKLAARDIGGERPGIDRRLQPRPVMAHRAHMVFMRMGDEHAIDPVRPRLEPGNVGKDQVNAWGAVHVRKGHAQIDHDQPFLIGRPVPVDIAIHTDLPRATEGEIDQPVAAH